MNKIQKLLTIFVCIFTIIFIVIYNFPATYFTNFIQNKTNSKVQFINPQGSIINGKSYIALAYGNKDTSPKILANPIQWKFNFFKLNLEFISEDINNGDKFYINLLNMQSSPIKINLPIDWFMGFAGAFNNLALRGQLILDLPSINWKNQQDLNNKNINLSLNNVTSEHFAEQILGSYIINFTSINNPIFSIHTTTGILNIEGKGKLKPLKFKGQAYVNNEYQRQQLQPLLRLLGNSKNNSQITQIEF